MNKPLIIGNGRMGMGLLAAALALSASCGGSFTLEPMGSRRRPMLAPDPDPDPDPMPTKHDIERMAKAQAKRERKASKRKREGRA